jgi:hypothetical protein
MFTENELAVDDASVPVGSIVVGGVVTGIGTVVWPPNITGSNCVLPPLVVVNV